MKKTNDVSGVGGWLFLFITFLYIGGVYQVFDSLFGVEWVKNHKDDLNFEFF